MYRIDTLLKQKRQLFHTGDLELLWGITDKNTLYTTISRYIKKGILISIHKGFYSTRPLSGLDNLELGISYLHTYAYVSCEYILAKEGVIFQNINAITLVSSLSKYFTIGSSDFRTRKLKDIYLYNQVGVTKQGNVFVASMDRAIADMLYFNSQYHIDTLKLVNWNSVTQMRKEVGYI